LGLRERPLPRGAGPATIPPHRRRADVRRRGGGGHRGRLARVGRRVPDAARQRGATRPERLFDPARTHARAPPPELSARGTRHRGRHPPAGPPPATGLAGDGPKPRSGPFERVLKAPSLRGLAVFTVASPVVNSNGESMLGRPVKEAPPAAVAAGTLPADAVKE